MKGALSQVAQRHVAADHVWKERLEHPAGEFGFAGTGRPREEQTASFVSITMEIAHVFLGHAVGVPHGGIEHLEAFEREVERFGEPLPEKQLIAPSTSSRFFELLKLLLVPSFLLQAFRATEPNDAPKDIPSGFDVFAVYLAVRRSTQAISCAGALQFELLHLRLRST